MIFSNGDIYEGQWEDDNKKGYGKLITVNNERTLVFEGNFSENESNEDTSLNGPGKMTVIIGEKQFVYECNFRENIITDQIGLALFLFENNLVDIGNNKEFNTDSETSTTKTKAIAEYSGNGIQTTRPFTTNDSWEVCWDAKGDIFQIYLYKEDGSFIDILANQLGTGKGSSYQPQKGRFYFKVNALGEWMIKVIPVNK